MRLPSVSSQARFFTCVRNDSHKKKSQINKKIENKSLSLQSLLISPKIREVDQFLIKQSEHIEIYESHPEFCFRNLSKNQKILKSNKKTKEGIAERLGILKSYDQQLISLYNTLLNQTKRKDAKKDDIIDAICLCLVNRLGGENGFSYLLNENPYDEHGIEMKIIYYKNVLFKTFYRLLHTCET